MDLSSLSSLTTKAGALSGLVLVSPQATQGYQPQPMPQKNGQTLPQPPTLLFHYEGEQNVTLESDITDHYVEDNTALQDQISLKPEMITTHGFIGELNNVAPLSIPGINSIPDKLTLVGAFKPALSVTALIAYNEAVFLYNSLASVANSAVSAWTSINGSGGENVIGSNGLSQGVFNLQTGKVANNQSKQQIAFQQFYGYWAARTLFTVQTPWAVFQNMAIKTLRAIQDETTNTITDFEVTFKMVRFSSSLVLASNQTVGILTGRAAQQGANVVDLGTQTPIPSTSVSSALSTSGVK